MTTIMRIVALCIVMAIGCGRDNPFDPASSGFPNDFFPKTASILPLKTGYAWAYSFTAYDSAGKKILPEGLDLNIQITGQYGMPNDTTLVPINFSNFTTKFPAYAYRYELEEQGKGHLVVYRDLYAINARGLYIIGEYNGDAIRLYPREQLWLAYPADSGKTWNFKPDPLGDSAKITGMELLSTGARCYSLDSGSMPGISLHDSCYLYKQTNGDSVSYYYYHEKIGAIGYQRTIGGKLRATFILKSFATESR